MSVVLLAISKIKVAFFFKKKIIDYYDSFFDLSLSPLPLLLFCVCLFSSPIFFFSLLIFFFLPGRTKSMKIGKKKEEKKKAEKDAVFFLFDGVSEYINLYKNRPYILFLFPFFLP